MEEEEEREEERGGDRGGRQRMEERAEGRDGGAAARVEDRELYLVNIKAFGDLPGLLTELVGLQGVSSS